MFIDILMFIQKGKCVSLQYCVILFSLHSQKHINYELPYKINAPCVLF